MTDLAPTAIDLDDALRDRLLRESGGALAACFQCGVCTATCPWGLVHRDALGVRSLLRAAQLGLPEASEAAWLCTACAQCEQACPRQVPIAGIFRSLRGLLWERRAVPRGLPSVLWSVQWNNNPWSQPPSHRMRWAEGLALEAFDSLRHEILLFVGCTASFNPRGQRVARALIRVLRAAGVSFGVLGEDEPCCGETALALGQPAYFEDIARATSAALRQRGVHNLVTISPHAFDVFRNHYPSAEVDFRPLHYVSYLATLVDAGRLKLERPLPHTVTYHDPCLLGRGAEIYGAPRGLLQAIPEVVLVEMEHNRAEALCCGGGGGRMWMETPRGERFSDLRVREAEATGAELVVTACPFCAVCLEDSVRERPAPGIRVMDVAEVVDLAVAHSSPEP